MTNVAAVTLLARATAAAAEGDFSVAWDYLAGCTARPTRARVRSRRCGPCPIWRTPPSSATGSIVLVT